MNQMNHNQLGSYEIEIEFYWKVYENIFQLLFFQKVFEELLYL